MMITMSCGMDFSNFPYDSHVCPLLLYDIVDNGDGSKLMMDDFWYFPQNETYGQQPGIRQHGVPFNVTLHWRPDMDLPQVYTLSKSNATYSIYLAGVDIKLSRISTQTFSSYFFPTMCYVVTSWISFAIPKQMVSDNEILMQCTPIDKSLLTRA